MSSAIDKGKSMNEFGADTEPWVLAALVMLAMIAGWSAGWWRGRALRGGNADSAGNKFSDAIMALLGLLLAFTFSMSLVKHEQRRQMSVSDSNAIGDFYTCVSLLEDPLRGNIQGLLRKYVEHRMAIARPSTDEASLQQALDDIHAMHSEIQTLLKEAVDQGTPVTVPLVNTFNDVTSNHAARLAAVRDRLPWSILVLLGLAAVISVILVGKQQSMTKDSSLGATLGFILLVSLVIWVILDLNQPQRGSIRISQEPLEQLLETFE
jgi:hypothetical protein